MIYLLWGWETESDYENKNKNLKPKSYILYCLLYNGLCLEIMIHFGV